MNMQDRYRKTALIIDIAGWMIDNKCTVRQLSREFLIPRSTVHKYLTVDLKSVDYELYKQCQSILKKNKSECISRMVQAKKSRK